MELAAATPGDHKTYEDIFWGLLNSTEFLFNQLICRHAQAASRFFCSSFADTLTPPNA